MQTKVITMSQPPNRSKHGLTLVETMVAILLLAMTLGSGITALTLFRRSIEASERQIEAVHRARSVMESLSRLHFDHHALSVGTHNLPGGLPGSYVVSTIPPNQPFSSRKQVDVSVQWNFPGRSQISTETLTTIVSEALRP